MNNNRSFLLGIIGLVVLGLGVYALITQQKNPSILSHQSWLPQLYNNTPIQLVMPSFETVQINFNGSAIFTGTAMPKSQVQIILDGKMIGIINTDIHGNWIYRYGVSNHYRLSDGQHIMQLISGVNDRFIDNDMANEILMIDLPQLSTRKIDQNNNSIRTDATVFVYSSVRGLRVLQRVNTNSDLQVAVIEKSRQSDSDNLLLQTSRDSIQIGMQLTDKTITDYSNITIDRNKDIISQSNDHIEQDGRIKDPIAAAISANLHNNKFDTIESSYTAITIATMDLSIDTNTIIISGSAEPNSNIRVKVNKLSPVINKVTKEGNFKLEVTADNIMHKSQTLVLEQLINGSIVHSKTALLQPIMQEQLTITGESKNIRTVIVNKGESLWSLAARIYGDGTQYRKILDANHDILKNHLDLRPGMILRLP